MINESILQKKKGSLQTSFFFFANCSKRKKNQMLLQRRATTENKVAPLAIGRIHQKVATITHDDPFEISNYHFHLTLPAKMQFITKHVDCLFNKSLKRHKRPGHV